MSNFFIEKGYNDLGLYWWDVDGTEKFNKTLDLIFEKLAPGECNRQAAALPDRCIFWELDHHEPFGD